MNNRKKIDYIDQILIVQYFQNKMAQVGSQREDLEPSLKEAGTDVNWEVIGPIIAGNYFLFVLHIFNNDCWELIVN